MNKLPFLSVRTLFRASPEEDPPHCFQAGQDARKASKELVPVVPLLSCLALEEHSRKGARPFQMEIDTTDAAFSLCTGYVSVQMCSARNQQLIKSQWENEKP